MSARTHRFELVAQGGPDFGGVTLRGEELVVDFTAQKVRYDLVRSDADQAGIPVGRFDARLDAKLLEPVLAEVRTGLLAKLAPPSHGGPGSNEYVLRYRNGDDETSATLTSRDVATRPELRKLMQAIGDVEFRAMQQPFAALAATAAIQGDRFQVTLENLGSAPILVRHPGHLVGTTDEWCGVRVAELPDEVPGVTSPPLKWELVRVPPLEAGQDVPADVVLAAKGTKTFVTGRFLAAAGRNYLAQAIWSSYVPGKPVAGAHRIRGATFSPNVIFARGARD